MSGARGSDIGNSIGTIGAIGYYPIDSIGTVVRHLSDILRQALGSWSQQGGKTTQTSPSEGGGNAGVPSEVV